MPIIIANNYNLFLNNTAYTIGPVNFNILTVTFIRVDIKVQIEYYFIFINVVETHLVTKAVRDCAVV